MNFKRLIITMCCILACCVSAILADKFYPEQFETVIIWISTHKLLSLLAILVACWAVLIYEFHNPYNLDENDDIF